MLMSMLVNWLQKEWFLRGLFEQFDVQVGIASQLAVGEIINNIWGGALF